MTVPDIRPAEPRDVPGIQRVAEHAWTATYGDILSQETIDTALAEWYASAALLEQIQRSDVAYHVAVDGAVPLGYISGGGTEGDLGEVGAIYVHPDHWRRGIGGRLLERFETDARTHDWNPIQIRVLAQNDISRGFYETHGYERIDQGTVALFGEEVEEVFYRKSIE